MKPMRFDSYAYALGYASENHPDGQVVQGGDGYYISLPNGEYVTEEEVAPF